ncbi:MAG TPA: exopolysaccharide biosynthesis protein [Burkholderiales bacterium]|nr:exopolysaccharide biosynthesis protein [Burkholderiales bacterium]
MAKQRRARNLEQLLDQIALAADGREDVSLDAILNVIGHRSFGPVLLVAGLITLAPIIGDIPGVPTIMGLFVLLVAVQVLIRQEHFWLPRWMLERSVAERKLCKSVQWLRRPARFIDRLLRPRLTALTGAAGLYAIAIACALIALAMPLMEVVPFSANAAGLILTSFGLSLIARDGLLALLAFLILIGSVALGVYHFL